MSFLINNTNEHFKDLVVHFCNETLPCNSNQCHRLQLVSSIRYLLELVFDKNMRWNLHANDLVMRLRSIVYSFCKLRYNKSI